jgi:hypothetical protein
MERAFPRQFIPKGPLGLKAPGRSLYEQHNRFWKHPSRPCPVMKSRKRMARHVPAGRGTNKSTLLDGFFLLWFILALIGGLMVAAAVLFG